MNKWPVAHAQDRAIDAPIAPKPGIKTKYKANESAEFKIIINKKTRNFSKANNKGFTQNKIDDTKVPIINNIVK